MLYRYGSGAVPRLRAGVSSKKPTWAPAVTDGSIALMSSSDIDASNPEDILFPGLPTLGEYANLCLSERFWDQPSASTSRPFVWSPTTST